MYKSKKKLEWKKGLHRLPKYIRKYEQMHMEREIRHHLKNSLLVDREGRSRGAFVRESQNLIFNGEYWCFRFLV